MSQPQSNQTRSSSAHFSSSSQSAKYGGLIQRPLTKRLKTAFFHYIAFFDNYPITNSAFHTVITILRLLQFIGPTFMPQSTLLWGEKNAIKTTLSIFQCSFWYTPSSIDIFSIGFPILLAFTIFEILYLFTFAGLAWHYESTAKTNKYVAYVMNGLGLSVFFLIEPFLQHVGVSVITLIADKQKSMDVKVIVITCIAEITILIMLVFLSTFFIRSLNFHPVSLLSLEEYPQKMMMIYTLLITTILSCVVYLNRIAQIVGLCLCAVLYGLSISVIFFKGTFVDINTQKFVLALSFWGIFNCIVNVIFLALNKEAGQVGFAILVLLCALSYIISVIIVQRKIAAHMTLLDQFEMDHEVSIFKRPSKLVNVALTGFLYVHPTCIDFSIFKSACVEWANDGELWFVFAKFCAIYTENTQLLSIISQSIQMNHIKSQLAKFAVSQISAIQKTREVNLTPDLKQKIEKISKLMNNSKRKMRNVWDLILQGNTKDLETNIKSVYVSVGNLQKELDQLLMKFPNNRFVARLYARYMNEIVADPAGFKQWHDNTQLLQRGINVVPDNVHELGLAVFENIPNKTVTDMVTTKTMLETDMSIEDFADEDTKGGTKTLMSDLIDSHKVKGITLLKKLIIVSTIIVIFIPTICIIACYKYTNSKIVQPLDYLYGMAYLRQLNFMLASISIKYQLVRLVNESGIAISDNPPVEDITFASLGGSSDYGNMLRYLLKEVNEVSSKLDSFRKATDLSDAMDAAKKIIFSDSIPFYYFYNITNSTSELQSAEKIVASVANQLSKITDDSKNVTKASLNTTDLLIGWNNYVEPGAKISEALDYVFTHLSNITTKYRDLFLYIMIGYIILVVVVISACMFYGLSVLKKNKVQLFRVFTYLPKTVISNVSASFYSIKNNKDKTTTNTNTSSSNENASSKPEEAMLKVFTSIGESSYGVDTSYVFLIFVAALIVFGCLAGYYGCVMYRTLCYEMRISSPHINYLLGASSYMHGMFATLMKVAMSQQNCTGVIANQTESLLNVTKAIDTMNKYYHLARFGGEGDLDYPYVGMAAGIDKSSAQIKCRQNENITNDFFSIITCFDSDQQVYLLLALIRIIEVRKVIPIGTKLSYIWNLGPIILYDTLFYPMATSIVETIKEDTGKSFSDLLTKSIIFLVLVVIALVIIIIQINSMEKPLIFALKQLLHCPEDVCLKIPKIMSLLAGDYSNDNDDSADRDEEFFSHVVNKLTDMICVSSVSEGTIISVNKSFETAFGITDSATLIGTPLHDFFNESRFTGDIGSLFSKNQAKVQYKQGDQTIHLLFTSVNIGGETIIEGRDISMQVRHETLISDEKKRSDIMLASILPASLVPRVQAGESNISFAVKSVTVSFIDIVSFTPWCGSHEAQYVMKMLNLIFKEFDQIVNSLPTMTRCKCIGDCYMSAGGIFDEVNQPSVHAREVVEFGRQAIKKIVEIDQQHNEKLQIRVGVNTGGPIVAGILGTDKPTFEILGPAINMAQQMEHNGVPMHVHLSRAVYELIYGDKFEIKERGEIETNHGKMFTYLVSP